MRDQLIQYVNLLFAGAADSEEIKQEILQNTLDRYDDLVEQGKSPEAAYRLAISGIGDINEILGSPATVSQPKYFSEPISSPEQPDDGDTPFKKVLRAIAVGLYIICALPLIVLSEMGMDTIGLCGTLSIVAVATVAIICGKKKESKEPEKSEKKLTPQQELKNSVSHVIWAIGLALYFILSFATGAWYITWVIFPIVASVQGLAKAILDLKEANQYEN